MNYFTQELNSLFGSTSKFLKRTFVGRTLVAQIEITHLIAKIEFAYTTCSTRYNALQVTVIHPNNGVLDSICIRMDDVIGNLSGSGYSNDEPYIYTDGSPTIHWRVRPTEIQMKQIAQQVLDYIEMF